VATHGSTDIAEGYNILPTLSNFLEPKRSPKLPCHLLRPHTRNYGFFARSQILERLDGVLAHTTKSTGVEGPTLRVFALCGLGGVGKTQIAVEFAFSRSGYFDAIFWVQADDSDKLAAGFGQIAVELGIIDPADTGNLIVSRDLALAWLLNPLKQLVGPNIMEGSLPDDAKAKWLIIFDNADDPELLRDYWPAMGQGSVLITSRDPLAKTHFQSSSGVDLQSFDLTDASNLILKLTGQDANEERTQQARALAARLDGLPLAITQITAYLIRRELTIQEVLDLYAEEFSFASLHKSQDHHGHTLSTIWAFESLCPAAMGLLEVLSFMDPDAIPEIILKQELPEAFGCEFSATTVSYINARLDLLKSSLVVRNKDLGQLILHRLVQDVVRARMTTESRTRTFTLVVSLLSCTCPPRTFTYDSSAWTTLAQIKPHVMKLQTFYESGPDLELTLETQQMFAELLVRCAWYGDYEGELILGC
jgi:hypothetical protein